MKVLLRADVPGVGHRGDIVDVADGYARNYLVPRGDALKATDGVAAQAEAMKRARDLRDAKNRQGAEELARRLAPTVVHISAKAGAEGRLFGSVTAADLVEAVAAQSGVDLDRRRVELPEPIRSLGIHEIAVKLHSEVELRLAVEVVAEG